jgi:hypothetical protein
VARCQTTGRLALAGRAPVARRRDVGRVRHDEVRRLRDLGQGGCQRLLEIDDVNGAARVEPVRLQVAPAEVGHGRFLLDEGHVLHGAEKEQGEAHSTGTRSEIDGGADFARAREDGEKNCVDVRAVARPSRRLPQGESPPEERVLRDLPLGHGFAGSGPPSAALGAGWVFALGGQ